MRVWIICFLIIWGSASVWAQPQFELVFSEPDAIQDARRALQTGRPADALERLSRARVDKYQRRYQVVAQNFKCVAYTRLDRLRNAERECRKAMDMQPDRWSHKNNYAAVLIKQGRYRAAIDLLKAAVKAHGPLASLKNNLELAQHLRSSS